MIARKLWKNLETLENILIPLLSAGFYCRIRDAKNLTFLGSKRYTSVAYTNLVEQKVSFSGGRK